MKISYTEKVLRDKITNLAEEYSRITYLNHSKTCVEINRTLEIIKDRMSDLETAIVIVKEFETK